MDEKIKQLPAKAKAFLSSMGKKTKALVVGVLVLMLAGIAAILIFNANRPYAVLFTGLTAEDMSSVLSYLDTNGITDYKVQNNDTILVPESQEPSLKVKVLMEGYPSSGFGYSMYLDNVGSLSTESDRKTLYLFDLQERLSATVRCLDGVKDAKVSIAQGEDHRYILNTDDVMEAKASVVVTMEGNQKLSDKQVAAIRNLVGNAVQGLSIERVSITDAAGNTYSGGDDASATDASRLKLELEERVNNNVRTNIVAVLAPLFGTDNISVSVNSTVDVSRTYQDSVTYEEPDWAADGSTGGKGIIGSKVYDDTIIRGEGQRAGGVAGAETNADLSEYVEGYQPDGNEQQIGTSGEINYNVDTHRTQSENPAGIITDVMVSISINSNAVSDINIATLTSHVARAAGISADVQNEKISILPFPFYESEPDKEPAPDVTSILPSWVIYALAAGVGLFLLLLLLILALRRRVKRRAAAKQPAYVPMAPMPEPAPQGADIMSIHTERSMELRKEVRDFAENNPEIAAQMVKSLLKGGDDHA